MNTSKLWWALGAVLALMAAGPLAVAILIAGVLAPAAVAAQDTACATTVAASGQWWAPFTQTYVKKSGYGNRFHSIDLEWRLHFGTDLVSFPGPGPVVAASAGVVTAAGYRGGYGNAVDVEHGGGVTSRYAHLATIEPGVTVGAPVTIGQQLGVEGSTGASTGNHLHFEILQNTVAIDAEPFMTEHGAPLDGRATAPTPTVPVAAGLEGGIGFDLPAAGTPRLNSLTTPAAPIPAPIRALYEGAGERYKVPWTLLAGVGMEETHHGAIVATSSAGARGLMQFMPATFAAYGVDGDGDGRASITNPADSIYSAANYLTASGVTKGPGGVRSALLAYNHATWYVNDVLHYANAYGGGLVLGDPTSCPGGTGDPTIPPLADDRVVGVLAWARDQTGEPYVIGANGPNAWDSSGFTQAAYRQGGITMPRTAGAQRDWLAPGNGHHVPLGSEQPGDLIFWDSYLGPNTIGHVLIVADPTTKTTLEAKNARSGVGSFSYAAAKDHHLVQVWRVGNLIKEST